MDEKLKKIIFIVLGCFIILFLFLFLMSSCSSKITPEDLENKIVKNVKSYYSTHKEELPQQNSVLTLSLNDLVSKGIISELDKLLESDTNCAGNVTIENNNNYYMYSPSLSCTSPSNNYMTQNLKELLLENIVTSGNGLYKMNDGYYFRGDNIDNYIIFDGILWRITKINGDNTIRLIEANRREGVVWDDRYNSITLTQSGINDYANQNINSRIKESLDDIYSTENVLSNDGKGYIKETSLCIGKRKITDTANDGSIECSLTLDNQYLGLLQLNEYMIASLDGDCLSAESASCRNYNYLSDFKNSYWTLTANADNTSQVYKVNTNIMTTSASSSGMARMVINISENTNVTGTGSELDPYKVTGTSTELKKFN